MARYQEAIPQNLIIRNIQISVLGCEIHFTSHPALLWFHHSLDYKYIEEIIEIIYRLSLCQTDFFHFFFLFIQYCLW